MDTKIPPNQIYNRIELNKQLDYMESCYSTYCICKRDNKLDDADIAYKAYLECKDKVCKILFRPHMVETDPNLGMKLDKFKYYQDFNQPGYVDPSKLDLELF